MPDEHLTSKQPWGDIDLNFTQGTIFFHQKWFYDWQLYNGVGQQWTLAEKRRFHFRTDRQIWRVWSNRIKLRVSGSAPFAQRFGQRGVPINFDVQWVLHTPYHWYVTVFKMPPNSTATTFISNVDFVIRRMELDSADVTAYAAGNAAGASNNSFEAIPHEFGHNLNNADEYRQESADISDTDSVMNIGKEIRARHLRLIINELDKLVPNCRFFV